MPEIISPVPLFLDTLTDSLRADIEQLGATLHSGMVKHGDDEDWVEFLTIEEGGEWYGLGAMRMEHELSVSGVIVVTRKGTGETTIREVRQRTYEILDVIERRFRTVAGNQNVTIRGRRTVLTAKLSRRYYDPGLTTNGHVGHMEFTIDAMDQRTASTR